MAEVYLQTILNRDARNRTFEYMPAAKILINPSMPSGIFHLNSLDQFISSLRVSGQFLVLPWIIKMPVINAYSVDPDQTPRCAASDLGLHCLPMFHLWDARHKWVKLRICTVCSESSQGAFG